jgi:predicted ATP-grasp superfamily ATP-dependent carboligase
VPIRKVTARAAPPGVHRPGIGPIEATSSSGDMLEFVDPITFIQHPELDRPSLICAFRGWNDGGEAATIAARYLVDRWEAAVFAELDPEEFFDFQVTRPRVRLDDGVSRVIEWPKGEFSWAKVDGRDVVVFTASEPNVKWRTFAASVIDVARRLGSELLVTLGAFLTDVPHSRPVHVVGSAQDEDMAARLGLARSQYEGPTGIVGVLHDASIRAGLPSISLWAAVPHYLPAAPNPKAAIALVERASELLRLPIDLAPMRRAVTSWEEGVSKLLADSDELAEYVQRLESAADQELGPAAPRPMSEEPVPSADAIAAEFERFLREQGDGPDPGEAR